jgi:uncharacterized protein (TIRG00374 family)
MLLSTLMVVTKTYRWKILLDPSDRVPFIKLLKINFISHFMNIVFPFRAGELAQIFLTKKVSRASKSNITGSIVLNKFMELLSLLMLFYILITLVKTSLPSVVLSVTQYLLIFCIIFLLIFAFNVIDIKKIKEPKNIILESIYRFFLSLKHIQNKHLLLRSIIISLLTWGIELLIIYILLGAFNINLPVWTPILILVGINIAMLIPASSASFGPYEYSIVLMLGIFAVPNEKAVAFAITLHFLEIILVLLIGFVSYLGLKKDKNKLLTEISK